MNKTLFPARIAMLASLLALSVPALAIEAFTADYQATALGMQGDGKVVISAQPNNRWQYALTVTNQLVDLSQKTIFDEQKTWLRPISSSDLSRLLVKKVAVNTHFDWAGKQATWTGDVKPERAGPVALKTGDMDALLVNMAIVRDVAAGRPLTYRLIENGQAKLMTYQIAGKEKITIGGESREATKVTRTNGKKETLVWVVPNMPIPARILQRENGSDFIDLTLKAWR